MSKDTFRDEAVSSAQYADYQNYITEISDPKVPLDDRLSTILDNHAEDLKQLGINEPTVKSFRQALEHELKLAVNAR